jgi:hypothetical protein
LPLKTPPANGNANGRTAGGPRSRARRATSLRTRTRRAPRLPAAGSSPRRRRIASASRRARASRRRSWSTKSGPPTTTRRRATCPSRSPRWRRCGLTGGVARMSRWAACPGLPTPTTTPLGISIPWYTTSRPPSVRPPAAYHHLSTCSLTFLRRSRSLWGRHTPAHIHTTLISLFFSPQKTLVCSVRSLRNYSMYISLPELSFKVPPPARRPIQLAHHAARYTIQYKRSINLSVLGCWLLRIQNI